MDFKEIIKKLKTLKHRMHFNACLRCLLTCLAAGGALSAILAFLSLWLPIPWLMRSILGIWLSALIVGMVISVFLSPGLKRLIKTADALGLKERVITAWYLRQEAAPIALLQRNDAMMAVSAADFKKLYPIRFPIKPAVIFAAAVLSAMVFAIIPGPAKERAEYIETLHEKVDEHLDKLEALKEDIKKNGGLTEEELERLKEEVNRLAEELKKSGTEEDALKALSRTENRLEELDLQKQLNKLGEALKQNSMTRELGQAMQNNGSTDWKQALEKLAQQTEKDEVSADELAELLKEAAEQAGKGEVSKQMENAAQKLASAEADATSQADAVRDLESALAGLMANSGDTGLSQALGQLSQALQQAKSGISQVDSRLAAGGQSGGNSGQGGNSSGLSALNGNSSGAAGQNGNSGSGNGNSGGDGASEAGGTGGSQGGTSGGGSSGSGNGGSGQGGGGGAGSGTTNEAAGASGGSGGGPSDRDAGEGYEAEYEQLYDPSRLGGDNEITQVAGQAQEGGQSQYSDAEGVPVQKGSILPYKEILGSYSSKAAASMEKTEIPAAMKEIVREYFKSLE